MEDEAIFLPLGDGALSVEFGRNVERRLAERVSALDAAIRADDLSGVIETVPSFRALMVQFDPLVTDHAAVEAAVRARLAQAHRDAPAGRRWRLPVCYGPELGPDLVEVAKAGELTEDEVVAIHTGRDHLVYMIGFLPGHPYLGDLPASLSPPRRETPRVTVPRGSVAVAVGLTVIYPVESPGGWNLIGHCPVPLFDAATEPPALLAPGDRVRFVAVGDGEHARITEAIAAGEWVASREALDPGTARAGGTL